ncbi:hypothetical protein LCGC14_1173410 [marine sediment metagenome]|uniref:BLUF domain-containing protein n=2 Tax=root TaxID=1 RepID=A0A831VQK9_9FLAO|nr:BLUF domain-containing protein [Pricia antarctica]
MYTLTYESKSTGNPTVRDMEELMAHARARNHLEGITGCLIYYMGVFIQVLEGEKCNVLRLFERIKKDKRHSGVHLFSDDEIEERNFPDWAMGYCGIDKNTSGTKESEHFKKNLSLLVDLSASKNITAKLFWRRAKFLITSTN